MYILTKYCSPVFAEKFTLPNILEIGQMTSKLKPVLALLACI